MMAHQKPHVVCLPAPPQGHINPMIKLAKLLHSRGFYITLVLTAFNFATLSSSIASEFSNLLTLHDFRVETFPDGLSMDDKRGVLGLPALYQTLLYNDEPKEAIRGLLMKLLASHDIPPISNIILDGVMFFPLEVCKDLDLPVLLFYTLSACGMLAYMQYDEVAKRGYFPLKDESCLANGYLDTPVDWVPALIKGFKLKHLPSFIRSTNPNDIMFGYLIESTKSAFVVDGIILNTFADLEAQVLEAIKAQIPKLYTMGPLTLLCQEINGQKRLPRTLSLWKEDTNCLEWLNKRSPNSVIYVNYGSLALLTLDQLKEFAWGLANANHPFLWVIRPDLVEGVSSIITDEYMEEIKDKGLIISWCPQEKVLQHSSIAVFLTHCGWNSILESICEGVPMICWPFFAEQQTNCLYVCQEWGIGMAIEEGDVKREKVEGLVRKMMEGEKGKELKRNVLEWKKKAEKATTYGGSSSNNFDELINNLVHSKHVNWYQNCIYSSHSFMELF